MAPKQAKIIAPGASSITDENSAPGSIASILGLLHSATPEELQDAANQLQSLCRDPNAKDLAREGGSIALLVAPLQDGNEATVEAAIGALQNVIRGNALNKDATVDANAISPLIAIFREAPQSDLALEALETLQELSSDHPAASIAVVNARGIGPIASLLTIAPAASRAKKLALETLLNLARSADTACTAICATPGVGEAILAVLATSPAPYAKLIAIDLFATLACARDVAKRQALVEDLPVATSLIDAMWDASEKGRPFEACRAADALAGVARVSGACDESHVSRLLLFMWHVRPMDCFGLVGGSSEASHEEVEVNKRQLLVRQRAVLTSALSLRARRQGKCQGVDTAAAGEETATEMAKEDGAAEEGANEGASQSGGADDESASVMAGVARGLLAGFNEAAADADADSAAAPAADGSGGDAVADGGGGDAGPAVLSVHRGGSGPTTAEQGLLDGLRHLLVRKNADEAKLLFVLEADLFTAARTAAERACLAAMREHDLLALVQTRAVAEAVGAAAEILEPVADFITERAGEASAMEERARADDLDSFKRCAPEGHQPKPGGAPGRMGRRGSVKAAAALGGAGKARRNSVVGRDRESNSKEP